VRGKQGAPPLDATAVREFNLVAGGYAFFQALACGCELDLFGLLNRKPGRTLSAIARILRISRYGARVLLLGLSTAGLVRRDRAGRYHDSPLSAQLLDPASPHNLLAAVKAYHALIYRPMFHLSQAVRSGTNVGLADFPGPGRTLYRRLAERPRQERIFQDWLHVVSARSNDSLIDKARAAFKRTTHLVDVGGGDGTHAIALHQAFPNMKVTVFDLPSVCKLARANIKRRGMAAGVGVLPGDVLEDDFPRGVDGILFGHILNIFSEERNIELLRRSYAALPPGGMAICFQSMTEDDESGPPRSALLSLYFLTLASGEGMVYPWKDYQRWYRKAGFRTVRVHRIGDLMDHGIIIGIK
jgi:ubiquinone/menaquinone biosynthesis C-methylase UbiE